MLTEDDCIVSYHGLTHRIISADFHRNGVGGVGFYVALVDTTEDGETSRFLVTIFPTSDEPNSNSTDGYGTALKVSQIKSGNVGMFPITDPISGQVQEGTGNAAYRGNDYWAAPLLPAVRAWVSASVDAQWDNIRKERKAESC